MTLTIEIASPTVSDIEKARELVEEQLRKTKQVADTVRARHARALLKTSFPDHDTAIFTRTWETDEYNLSQLLSSKGEVDDIDLEENGTTGLTPEQNLATEAAALAIGTIGSDDDIWEHLGMSETEHNGWYEFILDLGDDGPYGVGL